MLALFIVLGIVLIVLLISLLTFMMAFYNSDKIKAHLADPHLLLTGAEYEPFNEAIQKSVKLMDDFEFEDVEIISFDNKRLHAKYCHRGDGLPVEIFFHGYRANGLRDGSGSFVLSKEAGFNLLLIDQRASGRSDGHVITFGVKEKRDVLSWVNYVIERFGGDVKIILSGVSMGASTVMMASELDLPENVKCITADCGYSSQVDIIKKVAGDLKLPIRLLFPFLKLGAFIFGGFRLDSRTPKDAVSNTNVPILFVHGETDTFVPCYMVDTLYDACTSKIKHKLIVKNAPHGVSFIVDGKGYREKLREFFKEAGAIENWIE